MPSNTDRKPSPSTAPKAPSAGKQAGQLKADSQTPAEPNFSKNLPIISTIPLLRDMDSLQPVV